MCAESGVEGGLEPCPGSHTREGVAEACSKACGVLSRSSGRATPAPGRVSRPGLPPLTVKSGLSDALRRVP